MGIYFTITAVFIVIVCVLYHQMMGMIRIGSNRNMISNAEIGEKQERKIGILIFALIAFTAFVIRIIVAGKYKGYEVDINCFLAWADMVFDNGFGKFYHLEAFTDYPPGYMYVLYVIGGIRKVTGLSQGSVASIILTKLPAMICDLITAFLIFKIAKKKFKDSMAAIIAGIFLITPAIFLDSAVWAQVDSVFTLFVVLMCYFITEKKLPQAYFAVAIGVLIKPQTLIFGTVLVYGIIDQVFIEPLKQKDYDELRKRVLKNLIFGLLAIGLLFLLMMPFGIKESLKNYTDTMGSYPYASVNGYNFWTMIEKNWQSQSELLLMIPCKVWGTIFIVCSIVVTAVINFKSKDKESKYYFMAALQVFMVFTLAVRMHERYAYPAITLMLIAYAVRPKKYLLFGFLGVASTTFLNMIHAMLYYDPYNFDVMATVPIIISIATMMVFIFMLYIGVTLYINGGDESDEKRAIEYEVSLTKNVGKGKKRKNTQTKNIVRASSKIAKITRYDLIAMLIITLIYGIVAFVNLGNMSAPETSYSFAKQGAVTLDFGKKVKINRIWDYLGNYNNPKYVVSASDDPDVEFAPVFTEANPWDAGSVFCWNSVETQIDARYVRISLNADCTEDSIIELAFEDENGNLITPINKGEYKNLFDEQDFLDKTERYDGKGSYKTGTYFDEIYHGRTAYEMIHHLYCYENTHPPLGKILISLGVLIFGMNPFGWRFMGTLFGIIMLPVIYIFAKSFLEKTWLAVCTTLLFAFDFMHFVQTRIATIDVFVTFFIIVSYYFMYCYTKKSFYDTDLKKTFIPLGLCGIFMGFSFASKWTGIYAGAGLCVIFFATMIQRFREYLFARKTPNLVSDGISHKYIIENFFNKFWKTIGFCVIFFLIIPALIYTMSYIPFSDGTNHNVIRQMLDNQSQMYWYHSNLDATHPFSSTWYEWLIMKRPIWYYSGQTSAALKEGISSFGNPLVWWVGIPAIMIMFYRVVMLADRKSRFLLISFLAQLLPWVLVTRVVFIYHFFPSVPFVVLMLGYTIKILTDKNNKLKYAAYAYVGVAILLFVMFYPVLSGLPVHEVYVKTFLKWFPTWVLI